jgi:hypothetical protein
VWLRVEKLTVRRGVSMAVSLKVAKISDDEVWLSTGPCPSTLAARCLPSFRPGKRGRELSINAGFPCYLFACMPWIIELLARVASRTRQVNLP